MMFLFIQTSWVLIGISSLTKRGMSAEVMFRCNSQRRLLCFIGSQNHIRILFATLPFHWYTSDNWRYLIITSPQDSSFPSSWPWTINFFRLLLWNNYFLLEIMVVLPSWTSPPVAFLASLSTFVLVTEAPSFWAFLHQLLFFQAATWPKPEGATPSVRSPALVCLISTLRSRLH